MSQPRSGCNSWLDDLIRLKSHLPLEDDPMDLDDVGRSDEQEGDLYFENADDNSWGSPGGGGWDEASGTPPRDIEEETHGEVTDYFPGAAKTYGMGYTFLSLFNTDENSVYRKTNLYYPFSCKQDWEIASWLLRSGLSMGKIDTFLSLEMVSNRLLYPDLTE